MDFIAYHDRTSADHQTHFNSLYPQGYRIISLSVYQPEDPLYAAVWVRRDGPDWSAVHGVDGAGYQAAFDAAVAVGFRPTILSVAGSAANPVFAGVFEQQPGPVPFTRFGLVFDNAAGPNSFQHADAEARTNGWIMTGGGIYGDAAAPSYAGIWRANDRNLSWSAAGFNDSAADYQLRFNAQTAGWARPALVSLNSFQRYLSVFVDDQIGPWVARHDLTSAGYQAEFDRLVPLGYYPIRVQGGGSGAGRRFAVLFAKQEEPLARQWISVGVGSAPALDTVMRSAVQEAGVRGAAIAVVKDTRLVFARGYTNAEPGYPAVLPTMPFRIASVSKTYAAVAIHQLIQEGKLALSDTMQSILGLTKPDGSGVDPWVNAITVEDLLIHNSQLNPDVLGNDPNAAAAFGTNLPVTELQVASYLVSLPPVVPAPDYSNFGYQLLGMIVARKRDAANFVEALRTSVLAPLHMTRTRVSTSLSGQSFPDEARYHRSGEFQATQFHDLALGNSVMTSDRPLVPDVYGNLHLEHFAGAGGLSSAVVDQARLIAMLNAGATSPVLSRATVLSMLDKAVHSGRPRAGHGFDGVSFDGTTYSASKGGYLFTSQNGIGFDLDGIGVAVSYDGVHDSVLFGQYWGAIQNAAKAATWPATKDYFPQYGMPRL